MEFLSDNWKALLFFVVLGIVFLCRRLIQNRAFDSNDMLTLIWLNVGTTLTLIYMLGTIDFVFNNSAILGFKVNDINIIAVAGVLTLTYLAIDRLVKFSKLKRKKP